MDPITLLREADVRRMISPAESLTAVRDAFAQLYRGQTTVPAALELLLSHNGGEVHGKGAFVHGSRFFTIKLATGFESNRERGLPDTSGLSIVFDADTGFARFVLFDNGYLTQLRTASAGALAADLLARADASTVAMIGAGVQARFQLEALLLVRKVQRVTSVSRNPANAQRYAEEMSVAHGIPVTAATSVQEAVGPADIVVTTTPAREPVVMADWITPGTHLTAVGSDFPDKQELDPQLLARAVVVADDYRPGKAHGEIARAVSAGALDERDGIRTLGGIVAGAEPRRATSTEITIADLTGIGVQDAAVAAVVAARALDEGAGCPFDPDAAA
jgi:ornithine cyclodeaminase/alanine dehydrogenase-like protein (mu-crystallin family)